MAKNPTHLLRILRTLWHETAQKQSFDANEIDIVALKTEKKKVVIAEVKRDKRNSNHKLFLAKVERLKDKELAGYQVETKLLTLEDM